MLNKIVLSMASLRLMSGTIEICAALLMLKLNQIDKALIINSSLAFVGPVILLATTTIGLIGMADKLSPAKFTWVAIGIICLMVGILKK